MIVPCLRLNLEDNDFIMNKSYFRNIHIFHLDTLTINMLNHVLVPRHEAIRSEGLISKIYTNTNSNPKLLPVILRTDPIAKLIRLCPGNVCKITRSSKTSGESIYYRICK